METASGDRALKFLGIAVVIWGLLTAGQRSFASLSLLPGFAFVGFCMAAMLKTPSRATRVLAFAGTGCSLVFLTGPAFASPLTGSLFSIVRSGLVLAGFAAMLHYLLLFPRPGPFAAKARNIRILYVPAFLFWLLVSYRALFVPEESSALSTVTYVFAGLVSAFYLLAGVIVFLRRYIRTSSDERRIYGMRLILWCSLLGFVPAAIGFMPGLSGIPGSEYFSISMMLPPLGWALAALKVNEIRTKSP